MFAAIAALRDAFRELSAGRVTMPLRARLPVPDHDGIFLVMPALIPAAQQMAVKVVSVYPENPGQGLPSIHAVVLMFDPRDGRPLALLDGETLTALRTGAASGVATGLLARPEAATAAVFGAGAQGRTQLEAVATVRRLTRAWIFDPAVETATAFAREMTDQLGFPVDIAPDPAAALRQADVVCTATTSGRPVFTDRDVPPGTHINAVGAYTPASHEIPPATVARALVVVDQRQACLAEAGDLLIPREQGLLAADFLPAELGEILDDRRPGRSSPDEITLFKSVGVAVQDAAVAGRVLDAAAEIGLGREVML
ncbi:MAG: ornithine cyclodeaminase [Acidobacteria bacterium]|nr:ornithine cyclodeaminase [Acidobacteriota bacterium]